jgi:hypothetical protein
VVEKAAVQPEPGAMAGIDDAAMIATLDRIGELGDDRRAAAAKA